MLCYDLSEQDFVIFQSHNDQVLERFLQARPATKVASSMHVSRNNNTKSETMGVALGGLNLMWYVRPLAMSADGTRLFAVPSLSAARVSSGCAAAGFKEPNGTQIGFRTWGSGTSAIFEESTLN